MAYWALLIPSVSLINFSLSLFLFMPTALFTLFIFFPISLHTPFFSYPIYILSHFSSYPASFLTPLIFFSISLHTPFFLTPFIFFPISLHTPFFLTPFIFFPISLHTPFLFLPQLYSYSISPLIPFLFFFHFLFLHSSPYPVLYPNPLPCLLMNLTCFNIYRIFVRFFHNNFTIIVGYIVGLGDRHVQNILIDFITAELVHIDLG